PPLTEAWLGRERLQGKERRDLPMDEPRFHPELRGGGGHIPAGDAPHPVGTVVRGWWSLEPFLKFESEDSGVEMTSNEHSPSTPLGSESSFSLDGFPAEKPPGEEPPRTPRSRSASRRMLQAAQRSRRQRCPRQLSRRSASTADLAETPRDPEEPQGAAAAAAGGARCPRDPRAVPEAAVSGQGLRYLEHVCQMLERLARLQQDNRALRERAAGARRARPATLAVPEDVGTLGQLPQPAGALRGRGGCPGTGQGTAGGCPGVAGLSRQDGRSHWGRDGGGSRSRRHTWMEELRHTSPYDVTPTRGRPPARRTPFPLHFILFSFPPIKSFHR
uniref:DUF4657 domain-containing protein n=1 Tax=Cyanoderma ruficeps TaxID=181631 RepID=A0A8C3QXY3_9PASS